MAVGARANSPALERARQVFRFLKAFAERNMPLKRTLSEQLWSLALSDLPRHPSITIAEVRLQGVGELAAETEDATDAAPLLRVRRPALTSAPRPPRPILDWLQHGWEHPYGGVEVIRERNERRGNETVIVAFTDDAARGLALEEWRSVWTRWAEAERPARDAMKAFERLYELRGRIELESERVELMLGDGCLRWQRPDGTLDHPVLLQRVELEFDTEVPELRVVDADRAPELYSALLQGSETLSAEQLNGLRLELEKGGYHPLAREETSGYLRRLAQVLGPRGEFREDQAGVVPSPDPVIARHPVLFLRARVSGYPAAFDRVLEDLEHRTELPVSLTRLVGVTPPALDHDPPPPASPWSEPPDVLLSKPANAEQVAFARALERHRAVLVQGPPGTGKSHTIANLIGHLVAHGKRVLVTSHTTKALRVLRGQVVEALQPLCVAVLEHDLEARTQMEQSVRGILSRITTTHEETLVREVEQLTKIRGELNAGIERLTADLRVAREAEYRPIIVAGQSVAPADAARWVSECWSGNDWIPGPVEPGAPLPLDSTELADLYATNGSITPVEELEIRTHLPDPRRLVTGDQFAGLVAALEVVEPEELAAFWTRDSAEEELPVLERLHQLVQDVSTELRHLAPWQRAVVAAGHTGGNERDLWIALRDQVMGAADYWDEARPHLLEHDVVISGSLPAEDARRRVAEIMARLKHGGSLGWGARLFKPGWRAVIAAIRVNGQTPSNLTDFRAIDMQLRLDEGRRKLGTRWARQAEPEGLPALASITPPFEQKLREYVVQFDRLLAWWGERWRAIAEAAEQAGFDWQAFRDREVARTEPMAPFDRDATILAEAIPRVVETRLAAADRDAVMRLLNGLEELLQDYEGPACSALRAAVRARDPEKYERAAADLRALSAKHEIWLRREDLLHRLSVAAPKWAERIRLRDSAHGGDAVPGEDRAAWRWRQLRQEIDRRAGLDEVSLTRQLHQRRAELRESTGQLIDRRAWLEQLRRTDLPARQALQGWADTQRKIGKGTGKRVPELQARARELLVKARDAVPVWIMPLARVAENFDPRHGRFDVVILDEASQSDVTGLLAWYLGDQVAVVGDHEQVSPLAVGQQVEATSALIAEHLADVPNRHLYDGLTSIYDLARQSFGGTIALREHFRCVPDIIEFSNRLSYDGEIRPLRAPDAAPRPHVVEYLVDEGTLRSGKTNRAEAQTIAALLKAATDLPEYAGKTMGAITLLGDEQAGLIQDLTVRLVGAVELERRRFVAGNSAQFQGDERDVVFLSMVDTPTGAPLPLRQTPAFKQRYNVAASRARDQLWLVHSLDPGRDLKAGDLRRTLIEHLRDPGARRKAMQDAAGRAESPFEVAVIEQLIGRGYRVEPQVWVGRYRIDMVVSDGKHQAAVECDGDRFHGVEKIPEDMARQAVLERAGWRFIRIRGTRFFRDPAGTMSWVCEELGKLGVEQAPPAATGEELNEQGLAFRERVIRRAREIMREQEWLPADGRPGMDGSTS